MKKHLPLLFLLLWFASASLYASEPEIKVERILQTTESWDGKPYIRYPSKQPQMTVLRIIIPPHTTLHWHRHPVISVAYVLSGELTVEKRDSAERKILHAGQALAEMVDIVHRGFTTDQPAELIVFYAGEAALPLSIDEQ